MNGTMIAQMHQNGTIIYPANYREVTDLEIITQYCHDFANYEVYIWGIPLLLMLIRMALWQYGKRNPEFEKAHPGVYQFLGRQFDVFLTIAILVNLLLWISTKL